MKSFPGRRCGVGCVVLLATISAVLSSAWDSFVKPHETVRFGWETFLARKFIKAEYPRGNEIYEVIIAVKQKNLDKAEALLYEVLPLPSMVNI